MLDIKFQSAAVKGLEGKFKGPKKIKASGKAAGTRKKTSAGSKAAVGRQGSGEKDKQRHRDRKSVGKRRSPSAAAAAEKKSTELGDGFAPFKKRKDSSD